MALCGVWGSMRDEIRDTTPYQWQLLFVAFACMITAVIVGITFHEQLVLQATMDLTFSFAMSGVVVVLMAGLFVVTLMAYHRDVGIVRSTKQEGAQ